MAYQSKAVFCRRLLALFLTLILLLCAAGCSDRDSLKETGNDKNPPIVSSPSVAEIFSPPASQPSSSQEVSSAPASSQDSSSAPASSQSASLSPASSPEEEAPPEASAQERYGRRLLPSNQRKSYDLLAKALLSGTPDVFLPLMTDDDLARLITYVRRDYPELSWLEDSYFFRQNTATNQTELRFSYTMSGGEISVLKNELQQAAERLLSGIPAGLSDFDKALAVFDLLASHVEYDCTARRQAELAGALLDGRAGCDGYSRAYQYLLNRLGIETLIVYGDGGGPHAWNIVRLNGDYYLADPTWGDSSFEDGTAFLTHSWAFLPDKYFSQTHTPLLDEVNYPLPVCSATAQNFFVHTGTLVTSTTEENLLNVLKASLSYATAHGYPSAQLAFTSSEISAGLLENGYLDKLALAAAADLGISLYGRSSEENDCVISYLISMQ